MADYLEVLDAEIGLNSTEQTVLRAAGVRSSEELLSVLRNFPTLARHGLEFPKLKKFAMGRTQSPFMKTATSIASSPALWRFGRGAHAPKGALLVPGDTLPMPAARPRKKAVGKASASRKDGHSAAAKKKSRSKTPPAGAAGGAAGSAAGPFPAIDLRPNSPWPVRNQAYRGTCVAFAMTALREYMAIHAGKTSVDLSEQFLFWAAKTQGGDPQPTTDGTYLSSARTALTNLGECEETFWRYNGTPVPGNVTQTDASNPSNPADVNALTYRVNPSLYNNYSGGPNTGAAAALYSQLQQGQRPVAITVPVFGDPGNPNTDNWNTTLGFQDGRVFDPPPLSIVVGGHAVCITGFKPDPTEPNGGFFILRNSWDTIWGARNPSATSVAPEAGYGYISATYIEGHLWEMCQL